MRPKGLCAANFPLAAVRISLPDPTGISEVWTFFFKKNLQIEPAFAFYDNPLAQSRQLTELPAHQKGARRKLAALAPRPDSNSLFRSCLGFRRGALRRCEPTAHARTDTQNGIIPAELKLGDPVHQTRGPPPRPRGAHHLQQRCAFVPANDQLTTGALFPGAIYGTENARCAPPLTI